MSNISLTMSKGTKTTAVSNRFIDFYMPRANGSYVKIYLYLLRCISDASNDMSLSLIADNLDETEKDITRALKYWEDHGVLSVKRAASGQITNVTLMDLDCNIEAEQKPENNNYFTLKQSSPAQTPNGFYPNIQPHPAIIPLFTDTSVEPASSCTYSIDASSAATFSKEPRPTYSVAQVRQLTASTEIQQLLAQLEQLLARPVKPSEIQLLLYLYESLGFSAELIKFLYEYCITRGKKSNAYIEKVALSWAQDEIRSVEQAKASVALYNENHSVVMKAFGLNRTPVPAELVYLQRWFDDYRFDCTLVAEACNRTMLSISKPDFKYTDRILSCWYEQQVKNLSDVQRYDQEHSKIPSSRPNNTRSFQLTAPSGSFNRFPQRKYTDEEYVSIEQRMLNKHQG